jgi:predicted nucleotidyltransferase
LILAQIQSFREVSTGILPYINAFTKILLFMIIVCRLAVLLLELSLATGKENGYSLEAMESKQTNGQLIDTITEITQTFFQNDSRVLAVFLFGSAARNTMRSDSDIDLALILYPGLSLDILDRTDMAGKISYELQRTVDLGEISGRNLIYAREALLTGFPVFIKDSDKLNLVRANLLGLYLRFNEDRKEVMDAYRAG